MVDEHLEELIKWFLVELCWNSVVYLPGRVLLLLIFGKHDGNSPAVPVLSALFWITFVCAMVSIIM